MRIIQNRRRQLIAIFLLLFVGFFTITQTTLADDAVLQGDTINSGETVQNDVLLNGTDIALNGTIAGDALVIGRTVTINGSVQGSMVVIAEDVVVNGDIDGSVYAVAVSLNTLSDSTVGRSLYFLGISLGTEKGAQISRDLTAVTLGARLAGSVGRDTKAVIGLIEIGQIILDRVNNAAAGKPIAALAARTISANTNHDASPRLLAASIGPAGNRGAINFSPQTQEDGDSKEAPTANAALDWIVVRLRDLISLLLIGGLALWLIPTKVSEWADRVRTKPLAAGGWGFIAYIVGFIGVVVLSLLILVIGISFAAVTLWDLASIWWAVAFSALALGFSLFILAVAFGSKVIVAYVIGRLILERFGAQPDMRKPWPLLLGLTIYVLLAGIPYLGWAISLIVTFFGLGAIWLVFMQRGDQANGLNDPA